MRHVLTTRPLLMITLLTTTGLLTACGDFAPGEPQSGADALEPWTEDGAAPEGEGDGSGPIPVGSTLEPAAVGNLVYACIRATACGVKPYPRVSNCVGHFTTMAVPLGLGQVYDALYRCTNKAGECKGVQACFGAAGPCDSSFHAHCSGGKAFYCDLLDKTAYKYDCEAAGLSCRVDSAHIFAAGCTGGAPGSGSTLSTSVDCADGRCAFTGTSCTGDELNRCDGGELQACIDNQWVSFRCDKLGLGACETMTGGWARCSAR